MIMKHIFNKKIITDIKDMVFDLQLFAGSRATDILKKVEERIKKILDGDPYDLKIKKSVIGMEEADLVRSLGINEKLPESVEIKRGKKKETLALAKLTAEDLEAIEAENDYDEEKIFKKTGLAPDHIRYFNHVFLTLEAAKKVVRYNFGDKAYLILNQKDYLNTAIREFSSYQNDNTKSTSAKISANSALRDFLLPALAESEIIKETAETPMDLEDYKGKVKKAKQKTAKEKTSELKPIFAPGEALTRIMQKREQGREGGRDAVNDYNIIGDGKGAINKKS